MNSQKGKMEPTASPIPLERLIDYQDALVKLGQREHVTVEGLLKALKTITYETLAQDLETLGVNPNVDVEPRSTLTQVRFAFDRTLASEPQCPVVLPGYIASGVLSAMVRNPVLRSLDRAKSREVAFDVASTQRQNFLLSLGWMNPDRYAYKHQIASVRSLLEELLCCGIVADEVGLGKTIVAGLCIQELLTRGLINSALILTPANLVDQWQKELKKFFDLDIPVVRRKDRQSTKRLHTATHVLMDLDRAKQSPFSDLVLDRNWGCLIVDEAHRLRNDSTQRAKFCYTIRAPYRVYLTATPVHNSAFDIYNLLTQLRPGMLGGRQNFRESHLLDDGWVRDPNALQNTVRTGMTRTRRKTTDLRFPDRNVVEEIVIKRKSDEIQLYEAVLKFLWNVYDEFLKEAIAINLPSGGQRHVRALVLVSILVLRELASHPRAALATLAGPFRARLEAVALTGKQAGIKELDRLLRAFKGNSWGKGSHGKTDRLLSRLPAILSCSTKVIVYAEFLPTVRWLITLIRQDQHLARHQPVLFHGELSRSRKRSILRRFDAPDGPRLLLSTDCGGEGLNLQAASAVVNYDFPWNPMRIEQRIGRVDRIGQKRSIVNIYNFITSGTIESYVYSVLEKKLAVCEDVMGEFTSPITRLMPMRPEDFGIGDLILSAQSESELAKRFKQLENGIDVDLERDEFFKGSENVWI